MRMKRYIYILFAITSFLSLGCENEVMDEPSYKDAGMLEVSFVFNQAPTKSISLTPAYQTVEVEAILNLDKVKWTVVSDKPWCIVDQNIIREGSGTFEVTVAANEGYDDREPATVSLCAGRYKANLRVTQIGNVFIMDQVFGLGMKKSGKSEVTVKVAEGTQWTTQYPDWMSVDKEVITTANGETVYNMTVQWGENPSASRLGLVELYKDGEDASSARYAVWQFGSGDEYDFDAQDGSIRLYSKPSPGIPLEIRTPSSHIEELIYPKDWITMEKVENDDNTTSWLLFFGQNPSDCNKYRETHLSYTTLGKSEAMPLPVIYQNFYHISGLISAEGFALFAEKFNAGENVNDWIAEDGYVHILSAVDMSLSEVTWIPVGTEEHPFNLKFKADPNSTISGFKASAPLFGVCDGAEIENVIFDNTCEISLSDDFNTDLYLSILAGKLDDSTVKNCTSSATVKVEKQSVNNSEKVYAGGLIAYVGQGSVITGSRFDGELNIAVKRSASNGDVYIGGITGYTEGIVEDCENAGKVADASMSKYHYVGGITGSSTAESTLDKCINSGIVYHASTRNMGGVDGMNNTVSVGGLIGKNNGALKSSVNKGTAEIHTNANNIYLGGITGSLDAGSVEKCYCSSADISYAGPLDMENHEDNLSRYVRVGGLVGMLNVALELDCSEMLMDCDITSASIENNGSLIVGGVVGYATKDLKLSFPKWNGSINFNMSNGSTSANEVCIGGVVGKANMAGSTVTGAQTSGTIQVNAVRDTYWKIPTSIGGIVGCAGNGCVLSKSTNNASLLWDATCKTSNGSGTVSTGGIVGRIDKGLATISECTNNGAVHNIYLQNDKWESGKLAASRTGGIIGTYGYVKSGKTYNMDFSAFEPSASNCITITDCHTTSEVLSFRGLIGGIAGYLYNADVRDCSYTGNSSNKRSNCNLGGIAGAVENTNISNCKVKASLYGKNEGSCECKVGGIVAYLWTNSSISGCKYFGHITTGDKGSAVAYFGGVVAEAQDGCSVEECSFGGSITGTDITKENYTEYIVGNKGVTPSDCSYWDGKGE